MDKIPNNTGNGSAQASEPQAPKKKGRKLVWAWIAGGAALLTALALVLGPAVFPSGSAPGEEYAGLPPLLYKDGNNIYLVAGTESIKLDTAPSEGSYFFRGEVSADGNTLYYLTDFNTSTYESDLMRIKLGAENARPERIAEHVFYARVSPDDKKILFMTGGSFGPYGLYICPPGGEPVVIDESVSDFDFGFSADGSYVYYYKDDYDARCQYLYLYSGNEAKEIFENNYEKNDGKNVSQVYIDESGNVLVVLGYFGMVEHQDYTAYLYEGGETKYVVEHASFVRSLGRADEFLYVTPDNELVFYDRGEEHVVSEKDSGIDFVNDMWRKTTDERFVFTEGGEDPNAAVLYEFTVKDGKVRVGNTGRNYYPDADFSRVAYYKQDGLYVTAKAGGQWRETKVTDRGSTLPVFDPVFDGSCIYYYYNSGNTWNDNTLYRVSLGAGKEEKLFAGVMNFMLWKDKCYAENVDGDVYQIKSEGESTLLQENASKDNDIGLYATKDGVYAFNYESTSSITNLYYVSGGRSELVCGGVVENIYCAGLMPIRFYD